MPQSGYPGYPAHYPPPATPKQSRTGLYIGLGVGLLVLLLAGVVGAVVLIRAAADPVAGPTSPPSTVTPGPSATGFTGDLRTLLLVPPASSTTLPPPHGSPDGTMRISEAAELYAEATVGLERLELRGYKQGATRGWQVKDQYDVIVHLLQFGDSAKASGWAGEYQFGFNQVPGAPSPATISDVPLGRVYQEPKAASDGFVDMYVIFARGDVGVFLIVRTKDSADLDRATKTARDQYALLPD